MLPLKINVRGDNFQEKFIQQTNIALHTMETVSVFYIIGVFLLLISKIIIVVTIREKV